MNNHTHSGRFIMLTLAFTAAFIDVYGVELLKWQMANSYLYTYTLALGATSSFPDANSLNTVFYVMASLTVGSIAAWLFCVFLSLTERFISVWQERSSRKAWANNPANRSDIAAAPQESKK